MSIAMIREPIANRIEEKIAEISSFAEQIPGVVIIHRIDDMSVVYMSIRGQKILGVNQQELVAMGTDYYNLFFNPEEEKTHVQKMTELLQQNNNEDSIALFQQVRSPENQEWAWYCTSIKIFMWDDQGRPLLTIAVAIPIDPRHHITSKIARLRDENDFLRKNHAKFSSLTKREREIVKYLALGNTSVEIAGELHISVTTVETHRKNIKRKLEINSSFDLSMYARAFDLI
jgi:DNA-binding CsgD family transcriptional regulator